MDAPVKMDGPTAGASTFRSSPHYLSRVCQNHISFQNAIYAPSSNLRWPATLKDWLMNLAKIQDWLGSEWSNKLSVLFTVLNIISQFWIQ